MTGHATAAARRNYYDRTYRIENFIHKPEQRVIPPVDVEVREFSGPCFQCEARGPCRHR